MKKILLGLSILVSFSFSVEDICSGLYDSGNFQKSGNCYIKQLKKNNSLENNYFAADSLLRQGIIKEALPYFQKAEQLATREGELSVIYNRLSIVYSNLGNKELELAYAMKYLNINIKRNNLKEVSTAYNGLGVYYANLNNYDKALEYYLKSIDYKNKDEDFTLTYSNIAYNYQVTNNYNKADEYYNKAIESSIKSGNYSGLCTIKTNLGSFKLFKMKNYAEADKILNEATSICQNAGKISGQANSIIHLGISSIEQNNIESAKSYYNQAKPLALKSGDKTILENLESLENDIISYKR